MSVRDKDVDTQTLFLSRTHTHTHTLSSSLIHLYHGEAAVCLSKLGRFEKTLELTKSSTTDPDSKAGDKWVREGYREDDRLKVQEE